MLERSRMNYNGNFGSWSVRTSSEFGARFCYPKVFAAFPPEFIVNLLFPLLDIRFRTVNYNGGDDSHSTSRS